MKNFLFIFCFVLSLLPGANAYGSNSDSPKTNRRNQAMQRGNHPEAAEMIAPEQIANAEAASASTLVPEPNKTVQAGTTRTEQTQSNTGNVLGYISFGMGLFVATFGFLSFLNPVFGVFLLLMGIAAIILGAIAKKKKPKKKVFATVGIIAGIVGSILSIAGIVFWIVVIATLFTA